MQLSTLIYKIFILGLIAYTPITFGKEKNEKPTSSINSKMTLLQSSLTPEKNTIETKAEYAILVDADTDTVLFEKNADYPMIPSSMSKLMTAYLVLERIKEGTLSLQDTFTISEKAWRMQGSKMFVPLGGQVPVEELLIGAMALSGNDACIALAEGLMGSEEAFANAMNKKAVELGMKGSYFKNASGWPEAGHVMTARDLATLAKRIIKDFPDYYHYFSIKEHIYNNIKQGNRNTLLSKNIGVDGLKTGHTDEARYGITASAIRNNRRLIVVINGLENQGTRAREAEFLFNYGFLNYTNLEIAKRGTTLEHIPVWMGIEKTLPISAIENLTITLPKAETNKVKIALEYEAPLKAPIKKGDHVADLIVELPSQAKKIFPLYSEHDIGNVSFMKRIINNIKYTFFGAY